MRGLPSPPPSPARARGSAPSPQPSPASGRGSRARLSLLLIASLLGGTIEAADLLSAMRLADTIITGERRLAIIETSHGDQRIIAQGESVGGCIVKQIRADGIDLECRGRLRSLGFQGRARIATGPSGPRHSAMTSL